MERKPREPALQKEQEPRKELFNYLEKMNNLKYF